MNKEEIKQYIRNQIDSSIKIQSEIFNHIYHLYYNKSYLRVLKLSKITDKPVNKKNFKGGEELFRFNTKIKRFWYFDKLYYYLDENYSNDLYEHVKLLEEVMNEYEQYKGYTYWLWSE